MPIGLAQPPLFGQYPVVTKSGERPIVVVGASMAGITTVKELLNQGVPTDRIILCERGQHTRVAQGGGLNFRPNTVEWLERQLAAKRSGFEPGVDRKIAVSDFAFDSPKLQVVTKAPNTDGSSRPYGADGLWCHDAPGDQQRYPTTWALAQARFETLLPPATVQYGHTYVNHHFNATGYPVVEFANGKIVEADMLIAADGANSVIRSKVVPEAQLERLGYVAFRGVMPLGDTITPAQRRMFFDSDEPSLATVTNYVGHHHRFFMVPVPMRDARSGANKGAAINWNFFMQVDDSSVRNGRTSYDFLFGKNGSNNHRAGIVMEGAMGDEREAALRQIAIDILPTEFADIVLQTPNPYVRDLRTGTLDNFLPPQGLGRVAFVGDAAEPLPPHTGQGANNGRRIAEELGIKLGQLLTAIAEPTVEDLEAWLRPWAIENQDRSKALKDAILNMPFMMPFPDGSDALLDPIDSWRAINEQPFGPLLNMA